MIDKVKSALKNPHLNRHELKSLSLQLCNYHMNMNCGACITEAVLLLGNWLKANGEDNNHQSRALSGEFDLKKINLFVQVYTQDNLERQKELDYCLKKNKELNVNGVPYFNVIEIKERLTFNQLFELTKNYQNDINILTNSDIFFDESILEVRWIKENECYALSRWDYNDGNAILFNRKDSQDVWVFNGSVNCSGGNYFMGIPGCDNKIAFELKQSGYNVLNPSKTIHAIHLHETNHRTYNVKDRLHEPFHFIHPHL